MGVGFSVQRHDIRGTSGHAINHEGVATFERNVREASTALNGYKLRFVGKDRELHEIEVDVDRPFEINGRTVRYRFQAGLRDRSGVFNDRYDGYVQVLVIADLED